MRTKLCFKCRAVKPLSEFYRHPRMADGTLGKCKDCTKSDVRANRAARIDYYREWDRRRGQTETRRMAHRVKNKRKRTAMGPDYDRCHNAVTRAVASGKLIRPDGCERCGVTERIQAHHDDYTKPLAVMWLCPICHAARHRELGRLSGVRKTT